MPRSSTSSSDARPGFPWAGLAATLLVALLDPLLFRRVVPWDAVLAGLEKTDHLEAGMARDEIDFAELAAADPARPIVACVGNSRPGSFLREKDFVGHDLRDALVARFTHAGVEPFEQVGLADRLAAYRPDVVVLSISEFDTHRPIRLVTTTGLQSLGAVGVLVREAGLGFAFEHRDIVLGLALAAVFPAYQYRAVLLAAGLEDYEHFAGALASGPVSIEESDYQLGGEPPLPVPFATLVPQLVAETGQRPNVVNAEIKQCQSITRGPHVAVRTALLRAAIDRYLAAGAHVIVVEPPLHPAMPPLFRPQTRDEAHVFLRELDALERVEVLWLSELGTFVASDFRDLTHVADAAGRRIGQVVAARLEAILAERAR